MRQTILFQEKSYFNSKEEAEALAAKLNANEADDWTYKAKHCPKGTGYSFIQIYDESGEYVGKL